MATSTQSLVVDLIVQKVQGLNLSSVIGLPCPVFDGPEGTDEEDNYVVVHATPGSYRSNWAGLGVKGRDERYSVTIAVCCYQGGAAPPDTFDEANDVQAVVRSNARKIAAAIEQAIVTDVTLSIQNGGSPPVPTFWTELTAQPLDQVPPEGCMGRFARIDMTINVFARLNLS
jgi:hypothetical protein